MSLGENLVIFRNITILRYLVSGGRKLHFLQVKKNLAKYYFARTIQNCFKQEYY